MPIILHILFAIPILTVIHLSSMALAAYACGIRFPKLQYGFGPALITRKIAFFELKICPLLCGGSVKLTESDNVFGTPPSQLIPVALSGNLLFVLLAVVVLGLGKAGTEFCSFYAQVVQGAFDHQGFAIPLLEIYGESFAEGGFMVVLAVLFCKIAAMNMAPLPVLHGGMIILALINQIKPIGEWIWGLPSVICALFVWFVTGSWLIALIRWAL